MADSGIVRFDAAKQVLWRKTYASLNKKSPESYWGFCGHFPGQQQMSGASFISLLPDGSFAISVGGILVRIDQATGLPSKPVPRLAIVNSADVLALESAVYSRLRADGNKWGREEFGWMNMEPTYYHLQQYFFFPEE